MDRADTILMLALHKNAYRMDAATMEKKGNTEQAQRYRDMEKWFAQAIKREEEEEEFDRSIERVFGGLED